MAALFSQGFHHLSCQGSVAGLPTSPCGGKALLRSAFKGPTASRPGAEGRIYRAANTGCTWPYPIHTKSEPIFNGTAQTDMHQRIQVFFCNRFENTHPETEGGQGPATGFKHPTSRWGSTLLFITRKAVIQIGLKAGAAGGA